MSSVEMLLNLARVFERYESLFLEPLDLGLTSTMGSREGYADVDVDAYLLSFGLLPPVMFPAAAGRMLDDPLFCCDSSLCTVLVVECLGRL